VPDSFVRALASSPVALDVAVAREQHAAYVAGLLWLGLEVVRVEPDEDCPDCCFIEDTAVVAGGVALVSNPGALSRRGEVEPVARALAAHCRVLRTEAPATFDGGDCLRAGGALLVGLSSRTNAAGVERLRQVFGRATGVPMPPGLLHLKSWCSPLDDDRALAVEGLELPGVQVIRVPREEAPASNVVAWREAALMPPGAPRTRERLEAAGFRTLEVDTSELRKADGALTCLSILLGQ